MGEPTVINTELDEPEEDEYIFVDLGEIAGIPENELQEVE